MKIGISLASYLPWSAVSATRTAQWAREAEYDFLQVVPFRSTGKGCLHKEQTIHGALESWVPKVETILPVRYVEEAWNPAYTHRGEDPLTPIELEDRLFFPPRVKCLNIVDFFRRQGASIIVHCQEDWREGTLLEVHPGLWMAPWKIYHESKRPNSRRGFVLDTNHLRRPPRPDEIAHKPTEIEGDSSLLLRENWRDIIESLLPFTQAIHVAPYRETDELNELKRFLAGQETELKWMVWFIKDRGFQGDWVVEATLGFGGLVWWQLKKTMKRFRERLVEILEG